MTRYWESRVITESTRDHAALSQRAIYDERYKAGDYDRRSAVRVLRAEREALTRAVQRALESNQTAARMSLFDFGYGTGRVTNEWIECSAEETLAGCHELRVVAYDVSSVGLQKAQEALCLAGYESAEPFVWAPQGTAGYIAGSVHKERAGLSITVVFAHGCEDESPEDMRRLALCANNGDCYLVTTSWYSGLGHVPGRELRQEYFRQLAGLTSPLGEIVLAVSATGDLDELQPEWAERLARGATGGFPVEMPGDVVYQTELGQPNFYHVFGTELNDQMRAITAPGQHWWVEGIRCPGEEFASQQDEQDNYQQVLKANDSKRDRIWDAADYQEFHTVAACRSPLDPRRR
jgi:hypothetical protein